MINATVDYKKWFKKFNAHEEQVLQVSEKVLLYVASSLYVRIIDYTPVGDPSLWKFKAPAGYHPGNLKKAWTLDFSNNNKQAIIANNEAYAVRVEYGWSSQAPYGMMRKGIAYFPDLLAQAAQRYKF